MQNRIYREETITLLRHHASIRVRVALPGQTDTPAEERQYVEAELVTYFPDPETRRAKFRGYAVVRDNEDIRPFGTAVQRRAGGMVEVNQLFLHPDDTYHLQRYCNYLGRSFSPLEHPTYGLRLSVEEHSACLAIHHLNREGSLNHADLTIGVLTPANGNILSRLANLAKGLAGWTTYDRRERKTKTKGR